MWLLFIGPSVFLVSVNHPYNFLDLLKGDLYFDTRSFINFTCRVLLVSTCLCECAKELKLLLCEQFRCEKELLFDYVIKELKLLLLIKIKSNCLWYQSITVKEFCKLLLLWEIHLLVKVSWSQSILAEELLKTSTSLRDWFKCEN